MFCGHVKIAAVKKCSASISQPILTAVLYISATPCS